MAYELQLEFAPGLSEDLEHASKLRKMAVARCRVAALIVQNGESTDGVCNLLMDGENLLEAADALEQGKKIRLSREAQTPNVQSLSRQAHVLRLAIAGCVDHLPDDVKALEEFAYSLERGLAPLAAEDSQDRDKRYHEFLERRKAARADDKAFSERWSQFAARTELELGEDAALALLERFDDDPQAMLERLSEA
jgi:hypothetical protein